MIALARVCHAEDRVGGRFVGAVAIARHVVAHDADVAVRVREVHKEAAVGGILRIEREAQEPLFAAERDLAAEVEERARLDRVVVQHPHGAILLDDEQTLRVGRRRGEIDGARKIADALQRRHTRRRRWRHGAVDEPLTGSDKRQTEYQSSHSHQSFNHQ